MRAVDNGRPQQKSSARVLFQVVPRLQISEHAPVFDFEGQQVTVVENAEVSHVCLVTATDVDGDKLWYSITGECNGGCDLDLY